MIYAVCLFCVFMVSFLTCYTLLKHDCYFWFAGLMGISAGLAVTHIFTLITLT